MSNRVRKNITSGVILILLGLILLAFQIVPALRAWTAEEFTWPLGIITASLGLLVIGALTGTADMFVPASIVAGIGGILYLQNSGILAWESWSFMWTLIPGFVGIGVLLAGLVKWKKKEIIDGLQTIMVSVVLFLVFGSLWGNEFGIVPLKEYLPFLLIALGLFLFVRAILDRR